MDSQGHYLETGKKNVLFVLNLELQVGFDNGREAHMVLDEANEALSNRVVVY